MKVVEGILGVDRVLTGSISVFSHWVQVTPFSSLPETWSQEVTEPMRPMVAGRVSQVPKFCEYIQWMTQN